MQSTLHILNGDATLNGFNDTGLDGDVLVWKEVLSEGPVAKTLNADFWQQRAQWVSKAFDDTPERYLEWVSAELGKLNEPYEEVNLWFEFDLHCQVNLLGAMLMMEQQRDLTERAVYLICPDRVPGVDDFRGMGELNGEQLEYIFDGRLRLTEYDFRLAREAWDLYVKADAAELENWINTNPFWGSLHLLKPAMQAHVQRLKKDAAGHNYIEQQLLAITQDGVTTRPEIYKQFWAGEKIYGMGNRELDLYLDNLGL